MKNKLAGGVTNINYKPSEGERFIAYYLRDEQIKFKQEVTIVKLRNDVKSHRRADFYLPQYKTYVEFFGRWSHSEEDRERYREKKKVFNENKIPCVYLYPENLGIIEFIFHERLQIELKKHGMKKRLFMYRFKTLIQDVANNLIYLIIFLFLLLVPEWKWEEDQLFIYTLGALVLFQLYILTIESISEFR